MLVTMFYCTEYLLYSKLWYLLIWCTFDFLKMLSCFNNFQAYLSFFLLIKIRYILLYVMTKTFIFLTNQFNIQISILQVPFVLESISRGSSSTGFKSQKNLRDLRSTKMSRGQVLSLSTSSWVMCGSCHFNRASNDEFSIKFWMFVLIFFSRH